MSPTPNSSQIGTDFNRSVLRLVKRLHRLATDEDHEMANNLLKAVKERGEKVITSPGAQDFIERNGLPAARTMLRLVSENQVPQLEELLKFRVFNNRSIVSTSNQHF